MLAITFAAAGVWAQTATKAYIPTPITKSSMNTGNFKFAGMTSTSAPADNSLAIDFTAGESSLEEIASYGFDSGMQNWTPQATDNVTWSVKKIKAGTDYDFSKINPSDKSSLFVEGPYQIYKRECSEIKSPAIQIPDQGIMSFWVGMSLNFEDCSSLSLLIAEAGKETPEVIWKSTDLKGDRPWQWRKIDIELAQYSGKTVTLAFKYGPGTADTFNTGGYSGEYAIDDLIISGRAAVNHVDLITGEYLRLTPLAEGIDVASWHWSMPGATPAESAEKNPEIYYTADGNYDITLTVTDTDGKTGSKTRTCFASVTGTAPVAKIVPPATFRHTNTRQPLVAPMIPVTWSEASEGFPTSYHWEFSGVNPDKSVITESTEQEPSVGYSFLHSQQASLEVSNSHGTSNATETVTVEYDGLITNLEKDDQYTSFNMEDWGWFPGSNTRKITAYAEKFSKPSVPIVLNGVYAYFTKANTGDLSDQLASVGVHVYTSENGLPGQKLESWWWDAFEIDGPDASGNPTGTPFPIDPPVILNDEFFIVIDGIPEYHPADAERGETALALGMAKFRDHGNTTLMLKDGEWISVSDYFPAGANHTSLMLFPSIIHSVISNLPGTERDITVPAEAGSVDYPIFSYMGWKPEVEISAPWLRVTNTPGDMTVDNLHIEYDAIPAASDSRSATVKVTDGASHHIFTVTQNASSAVDTIEEAETEKTAAAYSLDGLKISPESLPANRIVIEKNRKILNR